MIDGEKVPCQWRPVAVEATGILVRSILKLRIDLKKFCKGGQTEELSR